MKNIKLAFYPLSNDLIASSVSRIPFSKNGPVAVVSYLKAHGGAGVMVQDFIFSKWWKHGDESFLDRFFESHAFAF